MEWKLFADLREVAGTDRVAVDPGAETVGDALEDLLEAHPALEERVRGDDGSVVDHVNVLRNGTDVAATESGLETPVEPGDELALFPPVSGG